jgi:predicted nucleic acid-binding protein
VILADTSIWVDHLARGNEAMASLLAAEAILMHPFIVGEIALGSLPRRTEVLRDLDQVPKAVIADHADVLFFIERHNISGAGIGYVDAHLLVATTLTVEARLWTRDRKLQTVAEKRAISANEPD